MGETFALHVLAWAVALLLLNAIRAHVAQLVRLAAEAPRPASLFWDDERNLADVLEDMSETLHRIEEQLSPPAADGLDGY